MLRADKAAIGQAGFDWLMASIAGNWAGDAGRADGFKTDKIPFKDRVEWAIDNEDLFLSYALTPKVNQGWMKADKPWQFIAACMELLKLRLWQGRQEDINSLEYESSLECYIDG